VLESILIPFGAPGDVPPCIRHRDYLGTGAACTQLQVTGNSIRLGRQLPATPFSVFINIDPSLLVGRLQELGEVPHAIVWEGESIPKGIGTVHVISLVR
jgi:hypothetical protein